MNDAPPGIKVEVLTSQVSPAAMELLAEHIMEAVYYHLKTGAVIDIQAKWDEPKQRWKYFTVTRQFEQGELF